MLAGFVLTAGCGSAAVPRAAQPTTSAQEQASRRSFLSWLGETEKINANLEKNDGLFHDAIANTFSPVALLETYPEELPEGIEGPSPLTITVYAAPNWKTNISSAFYIAEQSEDYFAEEGFGSYARQVYITHYYGPFHDHVPSLVNEISSYQVKQTLRVNERVTQKPLIIAE